METANPAFEQLKQLKVAQPFEPFVIERSDQDPLLVVDRAHFATNGERVTVIDHNDHSTRFRLTEIKKIRTIKSLLQ